MAWLTAGTTGFCAERTDGGNLWKRSMSMTPTCARTAAYRSGRWFAHAATSKPPLLPPCAHTKRQAIMPELNTCRVLRSLLEVAG